MGVGRGSGGTSHLDLEILYFFINFLVEKCFSRRVLVGKMKLTTVAPLEKSITAPPAKKAFGRLYPRGHIELHY